MKGFIVYPSYLTVNEQTVVELHGRLENGESFAAYQQLEPYLFVKESDQKKIQMLLSKYKMEKTHLTNFAGEKVIKISSKNTAELNKLTKAIHEKEVDTYEADIKPHTRFLIDNNIYTSIEIDGDFTKGEKEDRIYKDAKIKEADLKPKLKIASIDIETDKHSNALYCIGIYSEDYQKNFMVTNKKLKNVVSCKDEYECLIKFRDAIIELDPDILIGWNVIDFDLKFLETAFKKNKIPFDLGRTDDKVSLRIEKDFFRSSSVDIPGRQVLDGMNLVQDPFIQEAPTIKYAKFDNYTLEEVSNAILGEGKLLKGKDRHDEIESLYKSTSEKDHQKLADYNLTDCRLVYDLVMKAKMIDLAIERIELTGLPLDRLTASVAAFDSVYIREARKRGLVSPTTRYTESDERLKGGYVFSSKSGIYHNVVILDFKSLYPSLMRTFNIDPASFIQKKEKGAIEAPNGALFKNAEGILPSIIERLHQAREKAKKEKRELSSYAIKIIMNSFWGVLANQNCRYYNFNMASAITAFARWTIQLTAKQIEEQGHKVIYSDTDSVFVETGVGKEKANKMGPEIESYINKFYDDYVKKHFSGRKSFLEIQFKKQYTSMMIPKVRGKEEDIAAKKRYAGLVEENGKEEVEIVGLEAIRGDWTDAAKEFQKELLLKTFKKEPIEQFIRNYVKKIRSGKLDGQLIYRKSIRKNLDEYTKTTPPHVKAARQLDHLDSNIIQYVVTVEGPEPVQKLIHKPDYDHYISKQIEPIANQVLSLFNKSFEELEKGSKQSKLF